LETEQRQHLSNCQQKNKVFSKAHKNISFLYKKSIFFTRSPSEQTEHTEIIDEEKPTI
jgi:hypothetical protein